MSDWTAGYTADIDYTFGYYSELNSLRARLAFLNAGSCPRRWCKSRSGSHGLRHGWHANQTVTADRLTTGLSPTSAKVSRVM